MLLFQKSNAKLKDEKMMQKVLCGQKQMVKAEKLYREMVRHPVDILSLSLSVSRSNNNIEV